MEQGTREEVLDLRSVFGITATVTASAEGTGGEYVELDCTLEPGGGTAVHYHPEQDETYRVLEGTLEVLLDGTWRTVEAGETVEIPRGATHGFRNTGERAARFVNVHRPALGFDGHLRTLDRLVRDGRIRGLKDPRSLMHMAMASVRDEPSVAVRPPQWLLRLLARTGRLLGYRID